METESVIGTVDDVDKTEQRIRALERIRKTVARRGWYPAVAERFDEQLCLFVKCGECPMDSRCARPNVEGLDGPIDGSI